jgi:phosphatidate phosphatase LPIN
MLLTIKKLFPKENNPFIAGLGNRENDAIAYRAAGIPLQNIFIIDNQSKVHHLSSHFCITYQQMNTHFDQYFSYGL